MIAKQKTRFFSLLCGLFLALPCAEAQETGPSEYQLKAAFIYNIAKFIEWPPGSGTLNLCLIGIDYFGKDFERIAGKTVAGKVLAVRRLQALEDLRECRIAFISSSESGRLEEILAAAQGLQVLTVGDTSGYAERGVVINFYEEHNKIRFEINKTAADRLGLKISSKLLALARIVNDTQKGKDN